MSVFLVTPAKAGAQVQPSVARPLFMPGAGSGFPLSLEWRL